MIPPVYHFSLPLDDGQEAVITGHAEGDHLVLTQTHVPPAFEGRGIGARLARAAFAEIRANGWKLRLTCSFLQHVIARNPDDADLLIDPPGDEGADQGAAG